MNCTEVFDVGTEEVHQRFILACSPLAILFNCLVLTVAYKHIEFCQRLEQWFIVNMTVADLIFGFAYMATITFATDLLPWYLYRPYFFVSGFSSFGSIVFLLLLNVHKLVTLLSPLRTFICITKRKIFIQVFAAWFFVVVTCATFSTEPYLHMTLNECYDYHVEIEPEYYSVRLLAVYVLPLSLSLLISVFIFGLAQQNARQSVHWFRRILFVFSSTLWTCLTGLPYRVWYLTFQLCRSKARSSESCGNDSLLEHVLLCWLSFGCVVNPLITIITQQRYRQGVLKLYRLITCKKNSLPNRLAITCSNRAGQYQTVVILTDSIVKR